MSISDPRPAPELVYASNHLPLSCISKRHPKPVSQNEALTLPSPTCSSHSHPQLLSAKSLFLVVWAKNLELIPDFSFSFTLFIWSISKFCQPYLQDIPRLCPLATTVVWVASVFAATSWLVTCFCHTVLAPQLQGPTETYARSCQTFQVRATFMLMQTGPGWGRGPLFKSRKKNAIKGTRILSFSFLSWSPDFSWCLLFTGFKIYYLISSCVKKN